MEIPVLYHDRSIAVCVKTPGLDSESDVPAILSQQLHAARVHCVHRLDRLVGGVMVCALSPESAAALSRQIAGGEFAKEYTAAVHGLPVPAEGILTDLLFYDRTKNKSFVVNRRRSGVKEASLEYQVLDEADGISLLGIRLHTGRTHQIRVQFASRHHPLVGDPRYGSPRKDCPIALFSRSLCFRHPATGKELRFTASPPAVFPWICFTDYCFGGSSCDTLK